MTWAAMVRNTPRKDYDALMQDPQVLSLEDPAYWAVAAPYRAACGLPRSISIRARRARRVFALPRDAQAGCFFSP